MGGLSLKKWARPKDKDKNKDKDKDEMGMTLPPMGG